MDIQWRCYKYASETFEAWVNGNKLELTYDEIHRLGYLAICRKTKEVNDEIKRIVRRNRKQRKKVGFGFFKVNSNDYLFTRDLWAYDDDLQDKLRIYKLWKDFCKTYNGKLNPHTITIGEITPYGSKKKEEKVIYDEVDLKRPMKFSYKYDYQII